MLYYLNGTFVGLLILSNILAVKLFSIGNWVVLPVAVVVYVFTYPIIDVISEVYGKKAAHRTVLTGFVTQIFAILFIWIAIQLPAASFYEHQHSFEIIFTAGFRVTVASLIAYLLSQNLDVLIFDKLKKRYGQKKLWIRKNASTMTSQLVDTSLFLTIAFIGTMPISALLALIVSQYVFKFVVTIFETPLVYGLVALCRKTDRQGIQESLLSSK
jgi:uncharacterized integral membrane protein (TIGR00697 family)